MSDRRRAAKREPVVVELNDGSELEAIPLPWMSRNDLGNEIIRQFIEVTNLNIKAFTDPEGVPQLEAYTEDKLKDPIVILKMAYPDVDESVYVPLTDLEILELILASMDANGLGHIKNLVDPNWQAPMKPGGSEESGQNLESETPKMPSTPDSDLQDSTEEKPSTSPTTSSQPLKTNGSDSDGASDIGASP